MLRKKSILFLLLLLSIKGFSQDGMTMAHFRTINLRVGVANDTRFPGLMIKPELHLNLLNGIVELNGHYQYQLALLESWDKEIENRDDALVGLGYDLPYEAYEAQIGFNFFRRLNEDAQISWGGRHGSFYIMRSGPGSRAIMLGVHGGVGSFRSKTGIYDQPFNLIDKHGNILFSAIDNSNPTDYYTWETYTNFISKYTFFGIHFNNAVKLDAHSRNVRNGKVTRYYVDLMTRPNFEVGRMFSSIGEEFTAVPLTGDAWDKVGFRAGAVRTHTATFSVTYRLEVGRLPSLSTYGTGDQSTYFSFSLGLNLSPKVLPVRLESSY